MLPSPDLLHVHSLEDFNLDNPELMVLRRISTRHLREEDNETPKGEGGNSPSHALSGLLQKHFMDYIERRKVSLFQSPTAEDPLATVEVSSGSKSPRSPQRKASTNLSPKRNSLPEVKSHGNETER